MGKRRRQHSVRAVLTYAELDIESLELQGVRNSLESGGIGYLDCMSDTEYGKQEASQFAEMMSLSEWVLIYFTVNFLHCPDKHHQVSMAVGQAEKKKQKNIIVLIPDYMIALLPQDLECFSRVILRRVGWEKEMLNLLQQKPPPLAQSICGNRNHVNISSLNQPTIMSEPERTEFVSNEEGSTFFPKLSLKTIFNRVRRKRLREHKQCEDVRQDGLVRAIAKAKKKNQFWNVFDRLVAPHRPTCVCYIQFICSMEVLVLLMANIFLFLKSSDKTSLLYFETILFFMLFLILPILNMALLHSCSQVISKIRRLALSRMIVLYEVMGVVLSAVTYIGLSVFYDDDTMTISLKTAWEIYGGHRVPQSREDILVLHWMAGRKFSVTTWCFVLCLYLPSCRNAFRRVVSVLALSFYLVLAKTELQLTTSFQTGLCFYLTLTIFYVSVCYLAMLVWACFKNDAEPLCVESCFHWRPSAIQFGFKSLLFVLALVYHIVMT